MSGPERSAGLFQGVMTFGKFLQDEKLGGEFCKLPHTVDAPVSGVSFRMGTGFHLGADILDKKLFF